MEKPVPKQAETAITNVTSGANPAKPPAHNDMAKEISPINERKVFHVNTANGRDTIKPTPTSVARWSSGTPRLTPTYTIKTNNKKAENATTATLTLKSIF